MKISLGFLLAPVFSVNIGYQLLHQSMHFLTPSVASSAATSSSRPLPEDVVSDAEVIAAWEAIDFSNFQVSLEDQASQIVDMQENRINQRKELAEKTQTLRTGPEVPTHAVDLIKLYQKSLDDVTTQAKYSTNAFLTAYKILRDLPDPLYTLSQVTQRISATQARIKQLEEREESLTNALRASREKARGVDELRAEREQFKESVQLDGAAKLESERAAAQEKLIAAQAHFEEEISKIQTQLDLALEEIDRLRSLETEASQQSVSTSRMRANSSELESARAEGYKTAEALFASKLEEAARLADESSKQYLAQLDDLRTTVSVQMEQIGDLKAELSKRPEPGTVEKLRAQLAVMTRLTSDNPQMKEDESTRLDGLESWLLSTNQRLVKELGQAKDEMAKMKSELEQQKSLTNKADAASDLLLSNASRSTRGNEIDEAATQNSAPVLKAQRDRLRAALEKRDLEIERLQNLVDERDQRIRRLEDDTEKLRQRIRFLQSYKVSEKSTLLPGNAADPEAATASLGRGVGHEFRALWEAEKKRNSLVEVLRASLVGKRRDYRVILFACYFCALHFWLIFLLGQGQGGL